MKDFKAYHFAAMDPDERIDMVLRRHKVALGSRISIFVLGAILPVGVYALIVTYTTLLDDPTSFSYVLLVLLGSVFYLYIVLFMYHAWVDYYLDIWVVTTKRIIATDQQGLFHRVSSELLLNQIQDVSSTVRGFLPTIFQYGTIEVQTASEQDKFTFAEVPKADRVARRILELHNEYQPQRPVQQPGQHQTMTGQASQSSDAS